jgi:hypothetical protein
MIRLSDVIIIIIGTTAPFEPRPSSEASASCPYRSSCFGPSGHCFFGFRDNTFFFRAGCQPYVQPPAILEDRLDCFLVWVLVIDQSGMGDPTSSYATASIAPWLIRPLKPHHLVKVSQSLGGAPIYIHTHFLMGPAVMQFFTYLSTEVYVFLYSLY